MVGAAVLVVEVVGVFPHIESQKRLERAAERIAGVCLLGNLQVPFLVGGKPYPAGAEESGALFLELCFESLKAAEITYYGIGQCSLGG